MRRAGCAAGRDLPARLARSEGRRPLDFALTGVLARLAGPLAEAGVSIFAISTYDTDYLFVREEQFGIAIDALRRAGFAIA